MCVFGHSSQLPCSSFPMACIFFVIEICYFRSSVTSLEHIRSNVYKVKLQEIYISLKDLNFPCGVSLEEPYDEEFDGLVVLLLLSKEECGLGCDVTSDDSACVC